MKKIRILHTADLHLETSFFTVEEKQRLLRHELLQSFLKIMEIAKEYRVDAVVISGDITDGGKLSEAAKNVVNKAFSQLEIPVFLIMGNHDEGFSCELPENVHIFSDTDKYSLGDADIYGSSFEYGYKAVNSDNSKINIMLFHGNVGGNEDNPISIYDIQNSGMDYIALGHIHKSEGLKKAGNTFYAYSGVPQGRGFDEQGQKGVIIADVYKNNVETQFITTSKREFCELCVDISECCDYVEVLEKINCQSKDNLYKIRLKGSPVGYIDFKTLKAVLEQELFYVKLVDETTAEVDITSESEEESLTGYFIKNVLDAGGDRQVLKYGLTALKGERIYIDED